MSKRDISSVLRLRLADCVVARQHHEAMGVWGLAPILGLLSFRPIQTTSSGGCKIFLKPLTTYIF